MSDKAVPIQGTSSIERPNGTVTEAVVDDACRLSAHALLLSGGRLGEGAEFDVALRGAGGEAPLKSLSFAYSVAEHPDDEVSPRTLLMIFFEPGQHCSADDVIAVRAGRRALEITYGALDDLITDLKTFLRRALAPLDADQRNAVTGFLAKALAVEPDRGAMQVGETLYEVRCALRERLPLYVHAPEQPQGISIDSIWSVDDYSFYMHGWFRDEEADTVRLTAVSPEGDRAELLGNIYRFSRPDVTEFFSGGSLSRQRADERCGFISFFRLEAPSFTNAGWLIEIENADGVVLETGGPAVIRDVTATRSQLLGDAGRGRLPDDELMANHVMPALTQIQQEVEASIKIDTVSDFGELPESPTVSIIIPLYKRMDLIEQQLAEFVLDPEISESELIYVLDSPEQEDELLFLASRLFPLYQVPMRIAILKRNVGFAGANNAGASIARGRLLMFMNSDVLPDRPGWLGTLAGFYDDTPNIGALAPKVLYEDGSIQNAGMRFHKPHGTSVWIDAHFYRGLHRNFPPATVPRRVPLVSGACFMISHQLYDELGGLRGIYVQGDYEDSDLCMRLNELGHENWYLPDAEVYHLEGTSYTSDARMPFNRYNGWLHSHLWKDRIESVMARYEGDGASRDDGGVGTRVQARGAGLDGEEPRSS